MKRSASVKKRCKDCQTVRRNGGVLFVICKNKRHKARQA